MWKEYYHTPGIYDFDYALSRFKLDPLIRVNFKDRWADIPIETEGVRTVVRVKAEGTTEEPIFTVMGEHDEIQDIIFEKVRDIFQWDKDLNEIHQFFQKTELSMLFFTYQGTPIVKDFDLYASLMKVIIHQQLNMKFAYTLSTRFVHKFGEEIDGSWFYPRPEQVAKLDYDDLRELQFSQRKAEYVIDTSRLIANGELDLNKLSKMENEAIMKELGKVRGVGPWTVENWMLFALGRDDIFPVQDIGIQNALKKWWRKTEKPAKEEILEKADEWKPYRSYASLTLWRSIEG